MCNEKELLVGYLYDDVTAEERRSFEAHLLTCGACRSELDSLRGTRAQLSMWAPPERALGFRMVRDAAEPASNVVPFRQRWMPAFALAAAAVLVLATATAIANLEIRYDDDGLVVRTGWGRATVPAATATAPLAANADGARPAQSRGDEWRADFAALETRLNAMQRLIDAQPATAAAARAGAGSRMSDAEMLRQVRAIVKEAESRQQVAVAQRMLQVMQDLDRQHRADVAALQQGMGQYQDLTDAQIVQQREQLNQLRRVATRQEK